MDLFDLSGRVALVTGGNGGIGLGFARGLARAGAAVMVTGRDEAKNAAALAELEGLGGPVAATIADLATPEGCTAVVEATLARFGRIDALVNNAGMNIRKPPETYSFEEWQRIITVNLTAAFLCSQAVHAPMRAAGGGKIIMIGSMTTLFGIGFGAPYAATKGGIVQLGQSLACAWAKDNVQVNAVLPGFIDTALTVRGRSDVPGLEEGVIRRTPAGRWGRPADFEGVAVFLAGPASDFVTGAALAVDGGYAAQGAP